MPDLFGTDGVRGVANTELTCTMAMEIGAAAATALIEEKEGRGFVIIGRDTRASGQMLESAITAGLCSAGMDVGLLDVIPTPAVAYLVRKYDADAGVVISASHNPYEFNGIKIFGKDGFKLPDSVEDEIEKVLSDKSFRKAEGASIGRVRRIETAVDDYIEEIASHVDTGGLGIKYAVDCANGASSATAPELFSRLGGEPVFINSSPDGSNINAGCGSTHLEALRKAVLDNGCDIGFAFDGDADRCLAVDENGSEINGDMLIGAFAGYLKKSGKLSGNTAVVTVMSNLGFEEYCRDRDIEFVRTKVGDRYVLEEMLDKGYAIGGEQSGHIILLDRETTGDGEAAAALILEMMTKSGEKASELFSGMTIYPQVLVNVRASREEKDAFSRDEDIKAFIADREAALGKGAGRILVRVSGTEPLIRVMAEGRDMDAIRSAADEIAAEIEKRFCSK
ncbi:MAG: phosphoglucosamine mutase [Oscillospiraceae bacterium]|jgi:phosphoglucosamine mutase